MADTRHLINGHLKKSLLTRNTTTSHFSFLSIEIWRIHTFSKHDISLQLPYNFNTSLGVIDLDKEHWLFGQGCNVGLRKHYIKIQPSPSVHSLNTSHSSVFMISIRTCNLSMTRNKSLPYLLKIVAGAMKPRRYRTKYFEGHVSE